jgi:hypothetical protein
MFWTQHLLKFYVTSVAWLINCHPSKLTGHRILSSFYLSMSSLTVNTFFIDLTFQVTLIHPHSPLIVSRLLPCLLAGLVPTAKDKMIYSKLGYMRYGRSLHCRWNNQGIDKRTFYNACMSWTRSFFLTIQKSKIIAAHWHFHERGAPAWMI